MTFKLSNKSLKKLEGVDSTLQEIVKIAITITRVDFAVIEGVRTIARQKELVASGASQTMNSKHITGHAVDLMAYVGNRQSWELNLYDDIADAMKAAGLHYVPNETDRHYKIVWGAAWNVPDIMEWEGTMQDANNFYIDTRRREGKRPFIDGPHFQIE